MYTENARPGKFEGNKSQHIAAVLVKAKLIQLRDQLSIKDLETEICS